MSFAVIHMQKIKIGGIRGIENHNERLKESKTNPDIDPERSHLNKSLYEPDQDKTYYNRVRDRIKELDLPKAVRKDAVTTCGFVCTSDKGFFDKLPQSEQDRFFKESYNFLKDRYGEKNVVAATVHYDEKTPHMHYYMVPVSEDGKLSAKSIFTRTELRKLQDDYPKYMKDKGFDLERGSSVADKRKHLDTQEFKLQTKQQEIQKTKTELNKVLDTLKSDYKAVKDMESTIDELKHLEVKKSLIGGKMTLSEGDYNKLVGLAEQGVLKSNRVNTLENENMDLKLENKELKQENNGLRRSHNELYDKLSGVRRENKQLHKSLDNLKEQAQAMHNTLDEHGLIPEARGRLNDAIKAKKAMERMMDRGMER